MQLRRVFRRFANTVATVVGVLFVLLVITIQVWIWSATFLLVGAIQGLEPAVYFTVVSFTAGFGDITLHMNGACSPASPPPTAS